MVAVTGFTGAGKTTYEVALLSQSLDGPMGLINGNGDRTLERNIESSGRTQQPTGMRQIRIWAPMCMIALPRCWNPVPKGQRKRFSLMFTIFREKIFQLQRNTAQWKAHYIRGYLHFPGGYPKPRNLFAQVFHNIATNFITWPKRSCP